ncbi:MAG: cytochrome c-type biogenesis protein CcmH [Cellvibrionaceae bacterium]
MLSLSQKFKVIQFCAILIANVFVSVSLQANTNVYEFDNEMDRERFQRFTHELRCPKCQSQNLAGSDSSISQDLKRELHRLISEGKSDEQVIDFMVSRYGDFVLYKPKFQPSTYILWVGPVVLLLIGLLIFGFVVYRKSKRVHEQAVTSE